MAKRGRPSVHSSHGFGFIEEDRKKRFPGKTQRSYTNAFYMEEGMSVLRHISETGSEIPYIKEIFDDTDFNHLVLKYGIVEQFGRMYQQDGYSYNDICTVATIAAKAYHDGNTAHDVAKLICKIRQTGEIPSKIEKTRTVEITEREQQIVQLALYSVISKLRNAPNGDYEDYISTLYSFYKKIADPDLLCMK